jgi:hypothetical protein
MNLVKLGSIAGALQAVAIAKENPFLKSHRSLRWFVQTIAKENNDVEIVKGFYLAEGLHANFHSVNFDSRDVLEVLEPIRSTVDKILKLIPKEFLNTQQPL